MADIKTFEEVAIIDGKVFPIYPNSDQIYTNEELGIDYKD